MKITVTGGAGFIGSHLVEFFQDKADEIAVLDDMSTGTLKNLEGMRYSIVTGSVTDVAAVHEAVHGADYVFHCAGVSSVAASFKDPLRCSEVNTNGTINVLNECAAIGARKVIFLSSASVYGYSPAKALSENCQVQPESPYAISKFAAEHYCRVYMADKKLPTLVLRLFNVYGPRQVLNNRYAAIPLFMERAMAHKRLPIHGDGQQVRDFVYVKDVVYSASLLALHSDHAGPINIGTGKATTINAIAEKITAMTNSTSILERVPDRLGDVRYSLANVNELLTTGFQFMTPLDVGLSETIKHFKSLGEII